MYRPDLCSNKPTIAIPQKIQTPANNPYNKPVFKSRPGVLLKNIPRLTAITNESKIDKPNIFPLLPCLMSSSVRLVSLIHALPNRAGEYQIPPTTKAEIPAASTASQFNVFIRINFYF